MINADIIKELRESADNASAVKALLPQWNKDQSFPMECIKECIKMQKWFKNDFDYKMEKLIREYLPEFMIQVFFDMKEFRSNSRNELTSTCEAISKIKGYPMETQDDKAFCQYEYSFEKYYRGV